MKIEEITKIVEKKSEFSNDSVRGNVKKLAFTIRGALNRVITNLVTDDEQNVDINTMRAGWDIAKELQNKHGNKITEAHVTKAIASYIHENLKLEVTVVKSSSKPRVSSNKRTLEIIKEDMVKLGADKFFNNHEEYPTLKEQRIKMFQAGLSPADIAKLYGVGRQAIINAIKEVRKEEN